MLSSRYRQEKEKIVESGEITDRKQRNRKAMERALHYSAKAISSSSFTTVVGLLVLILMSFTIGRDMGVVLAKGVVLSLVSICTTLPAMLLVCDRLIEKTQKKTLPLPTDWLAKFSARFRHFALPIFLLIFIGSLLLKGSTNVLFTSTQNNEIKNVFPVNNQTALVYDNREESRVQNLCNKFSERDDVVQILCYSNTLGEAPWVTVRKLRPTITLLKRCIITISVAMRRRCRCRSL